MEALVPALVAALLAGVGDRPAWYSARLGDAWGAGIALGCIVMASIVVAAVMAIGGWLVAPILNPNAKALLVAVALGAAGIASLLKPPPIGGIDTMRPGAHLSAIVHLFAITAVDRTAFLVFAFAARGPSPVLAAIGGVVGATALAFVAITLGEAGWRKLPLRAMTLTAASLLLLAAVLVGLGALRLI